MPLRSCNVYIASGPKSSSIELKHSMCCGVREVCFPLLYTSISWLKKKACDSNPLCELYTRLLQRSPLEARNIRPSHLNCRKNQIFKHVNFDRSYSNAHIKVVTIGMLGKTWARAAPLCVRHTTAKQTKRAV